MWKLTPTVDTNDNSVTSSYQAAETHKNMFPRQCNVRARALPFSPSESWPESIYKVDRSRANFQLSLSAELLFQGIARTQSPLRKNYALESPAFGVIAAVNPTSVQWKGLGLNRLPSWSQFSSCQVSMLKLLDHLVYIQNSVISEWWNINEYAPFLTYIYTLHTLKVF